MTQSSEKRQTVLLGGSLGRKFGRKHQMTTGSGFRDVMGYFKQIEGFERYMAESAERGLRYAIFNGTENLAFEDMSKPTGKSVIRIVPVIAGSKRAGALQTVVGIVLIVASFFVPGSTPGAVAAANALMATGVAMTVGGVVQMLSPQAKGLSAQDSEGNRANYSFAGPVNTSVQGNPVPLLYGRMIVGSAVISAGIYAQDQL